MQASRIQGIVGHPEQPCTLCRFFLDTGMPGSHSDGKKTQEHQRSMFLKLFLAFTLIPVAEIYLLITVGGYIGAMNTVLLVILTGFSGAYLARIQGMQTMFRVRESLQQGVMPSGDLVDALLIFIAGIVLLTPGFITDVAGILLLFPPTRAYLKKAVMKKLDEWARNQHIEYRQYP